MAGFRSVRRWPSGWSAGASCGSSPLSNLVVAAEAAAWLNGIAVPVRFVAGELDVAVDLPFLNQLAQTHRNVEVEMISGGGYDLPLTDPDACIAALRRTTSAAAAAAAGTEPTT